MNKYNLLSKVCMHITTTVYAESLEEAKEIAKTRDVEPLDYGDPNQDEYVWVGDLNEIGSIKEILEED